MRVKLYEIQKILWSPILIILPIIFLCYNSYYIFTKSDIVEDLQITNDLINKFGYEIDDEFFNNLDKEFKSKMDTLNEITIARFNKTFTSINEFLESEEYNSVYMTRGFFKDEINLFRELNIIDIYKFTAITEIESYEKFNIKEYAEEHIIVSELNGSAADLVRNNFDKLIPRFEELKNNGEHRNLYFLGHIYKTRKLLFENIFGKIIIEIILLSVLINSFLINYERDNKTLPLISTTKKGRNLIKDKLLISIILSLIMAMLILGVTLLIYFMMFDYRQVFNVPMSNAFNTEYLRVITWYNLSFKEYLGLCSFIVLILSIIFSSITFVIVSILKSSYKTFFVFFILFGLIVLLPKVISKSSSLLIWSHFNVFVLSLNSYNWLRESGPFLTHKHYEIITLISNGAIISLLCIGIINRFKKENIC